MLQSIAAFFAPRGAGLRGRLFAVAGLLLAANLGAWAWALIAFRGQPALLGIALVVYGLGLRHAVDADHIAAIDNSTRKLMADGRRPVAVGLFFALGHSAVVVLASAAVVALAGAVDGFGALRGVGAVVGTAVSSAFLLVIAAMNVMIFASVFRTYRRVRAGAAHAPDELDAVLNGRGLLARLFRPAFRLVSRSWHMFPLGFLFGLGFDTATEVAVFGVSAAQAAKGLPLAAIMVFPALFAAGMSLVDTADGVMMLGAYDWAVVKPMRRLFYNMTITLVSVVVAVLVGGVEALGLVGDQLGLSGEGGFWGAVGAMNDNFNALGFAIIGLFALAWALSFALYRLMGLDEAAADNA